ncbi:MAG: hypothetical protein ACYSXF_03710 [Planctomycetota bacterium]
MSVPIDRELIVHFVLAVAVCLGGWMTFAKPKLAELREVQASVARNRRIAPVDPKATEDIGQKTAWLAARADVINTRSRTSGDSSQLYGVITSLARSHGVHVPSLDPGSGPRASADAPIAATRVELTVEGKYESVASFLHALDGIAGFVRPVALSLTPFERNDEPAVRARYVCESVNFHVPEALAAIQGDNRAQ